MYNFTYQNCYIHPGSPSWSANISSWTLDIPIWISDRYLRVQTGCLILFPKLASLKILPILISGNSIQESYLIPVFFLIPYLIGTHIIGSNPKMSTIWVHFIPSAAIRLIQATVLFYLDSCTVLTDHFVSDFAPCSLFLTQYPGASNHVTSLFKALQWQPFHRVKESGYGLQSSTQSRHLSDVIHNFPPLSHSVPAAVGSLHLFKHISNLLLQSFAFVLSSAWNLTP